MSPLRLKFSLALLVWSLNGLPQTEVFAADAVVSKTYQTRKELGLYSEPGWNMINWEKEETTEVEDRTRQPADQIVVTSRKATVRINGKMENGRFVPERSFIDKDGKGYAFAFYTDPKGRVWQGWAALVDIKNPPRLSTPSDVKPSEKKPNETKASETAPSEKKQADAKTALNKKPKYVDVPMPRPKPKIPSDAKTEAGICTGEECRPKAKPIEKLPLPTVKTEAETEAESPDSEYEAPPNEMPGIPHSAPSECQKFFDKKGNLGAYGKILRREILGQTHSRSDNRKKHFLNPQFQMAHLCPNFRDFLDDQKANWWVWWMTALAWTESSCIETNAADGAFGTLVATGLFGLEDKFRGSRSLRGKGCDARDFKPKTTKRFSVPDIKGKKYDPAQKRGLGRNRHWETRSVDIANAEANISCAVQIMGNYLCGSRTAMEPEVCSPNEMPLKISSLTHFQLMDSLNDDNLKAARDRFVNRGKFGKQFKTAKGGAIDMMIGFPGCF